MLPTNLQDVSLGHLQQLVTDGIHEGKIIEFKKEFYRLDGGGVEKYRIKQHEELLKDISSFSNTLGGDLIIGLRAEKGVAKEVVGFPEPNPDALKLKIHQIAENYLEPGISMTIHHVPQTPGNIVLVIRIQRSMIGPHRVVYQNRQGDFWARNSGGAYSMDTANLREAFTLSQTIHDRIKEFREDRVKRIGEGRTPVRLGGTAKLIVHLIPQDSYASRIDFPVDQLQRLPLPLMEYGGAGTHAFNLDGLVKFNQAGKEPSSAYVQVFRNGIVEAVCDEMVFYYPQDQDHARPFLQTSKFDYLFAAFPQYLSAISQLQLSPPIWCFVTLTIMKDVSIPSKGFSRFGRPIDRELLLFPEMEIRDYNIGRADSFLRPLMDMVWNSGGEPNCPRYKASGEYQQETG